jgi:competence protein ComEA
MANRTGRARRRRPGALSVAEAEAELSEDVRRRLRASARASEGWLSSPLDNALDGIAPERAAPESKTRESATSTSASSTLASSTSATPTSATPTWTSSTSPTPEPAAADPSGDEVLGDAGPRSVGARLRAAVGDRLPLGLRGADVAPSRAAVAGLAALLAASLALALLLTWLHRPRESAVPPVHRSVPSTAVTSLPPTAPPAPDLVVHVTGAVRHPGLVELPAGSRVDAALSAAGGATRKADLASVNLARRLVDGEQIVVLRKGRSTAPLGAPGPSADVSASPGQPVDLNTATLEQLDGLPGVGPVLAQRIIDWRTEHNRFSSVDELTEVSGIGERTLADLRPLVHV